MVDLFRAEVVDIADPQGAGRVKVGAPDLGAGGQAWAPVLRGDPLSAPPRFAPGDVVLIALEGGDPASPVVLGALSSRTAAGDGVPAQALETGHDWNDLVVGAETREGLRGVVAWVVHEKAILDEWGFGRHARRGARALFHGPPGTGKTLAATVLARDLAMPVWRVDLSRIAGTYIAETEKNLRALFDAAEAGNAILLFDEADALFGKRSEVRDSHDRYANIEISYLLQRLEHFEGLAILTSDAEQNIDPAVARRLTHIVRFSMPNGEERVHLWRRALGALPTGRVEPFDPAALADEHALSGGQIMTALRAACLAAVERGDLLREGDVRAALGRRRP